MFLVNGYIRQFLGDGEVDHFLNSSPKTASLDMMLGYVLVSPQGFIQPW